MKTLRFFLLILTALTFFSGCIDTKEIPVNIPNPQIGAPNKDQVDLMIEPYESLGVKKTRGISTGNVWEVRGLLPNKLFGESFPGRIRWNAWVTYPNNQEFFAQVVWPGIDPDLGRFASQVFSEGELVPQAKVLILSTIVTHGYNLGGTEVRLDPIKFQESKKYRLKMVSENGTRIGDWRGKVSKGFPYKWNLYETPKGELLSPVGEKQMKEIAGLISGYTFLEKLVLKGRLAISPDPVATLISLCVDVANASNAPSVGWDYSSQLPNRRVMGVTIDYLLRLQQKLFDQVKRERGLP